MRTTISLVAAAFMLAASSAAQAQDATKMSTQDRTFTTQALAGNMLEVEIGRMAQQHAASEQLKTLGRRLADDHGKANQQLIVIAQKNGIAPPTKMPAKEQATLDKIAGLNGQAFDNTVLGMLADDHKTDIKVYEKEIAQGQNAEIKSYAMQTLPTLQQHLQLVEDMARPQGAQVPQGMPR
jgi:putative membrane protein